MRDVKRSVVISILCLCLCCSIFNIATASSSSDSTTLSYASSGSSSLSAPKSQLIESSGDGIASGSIEDGGNPLTQILGYVKDSFVRMKDGSTELYTNHKKCNVIRSKQKEYIATLQATMPEEERKKSKKYATNAGGISFEEYNFLQKGKEDRGKLANIVMMMFFAPNFVPYAFLFFPEMLPSPFSMPVNKFGPSTYTKADTISRERSHSVIQTMLDMEKKAHVPSMMSNINPFGKNKTKRNMLHLDKLGRAGGVFLGVEGAERSKGAELILSVLRDEIFTSDEPKKDALNLGAVPKPILMGMSKVLEAPSSNSFLPGFIVRGKVLNRLKQIKDSDDFLVSQKVDLSSISDEVLEEACNERLIGGPRRTSEEMIEGLSSWLDLAVKQPNRVTKESGQYFNENLSRFALLCYHAVDGVRDDRSASYLPRLMFQGQLLHKATPKVEDSISDEGSEAIEPKSGKLLFFRKQ